MTILYWCHFRLINFLFRAIKLTKNVDPVKYSYCGYVISFDVRGTFSLLNSGFGKNVVIFSADMGSFMHVDNEKRYLKFFNRSSASIRWYIIECRSWILY